MQALRSLRNQLIIKFHSVDTKSNQLPIMIKQVLIILNSLLMIAYIEEKNTNSFLYLFTLIVRPQVLIQTDVMVFVILPLILIYLISLCVPAIPGRSKILLIGQFMRVSFYNFFFEIANGYLSQLVRSLLITISSIDVFLIQETLNVEQINFSYIRTNYFSIINHILNNLILLFKIQPNLEDAILIMCFLYSICAALNQILYCPIKSAVLHPIIIYSHVLTIFQCVIVFTKFEVQDFPNLIFCTLILKIVCRFCEHQSIRPVESLDYLLLVIGNGLITPEQIKLIKEKEFVQKKGEQIIFATLKIRQKHYYEGLCLLSKTNSSNWLLRLKKQLILDECLAKLEYKIKNSSKFDQSIALAVEQLMESEDSNFIIQQQIIEIIKLKIKIQKNLMEKNLRIYKSIFHFINETQLMKYKLEKQYSQFPNQKTLAILCFLQAEILNDYISASKLSVQTLKQEIMKFQNNQAIFNMFNSKMIYLITDFDSQKLIINRMSSNTTSLLNLRHDQLINQEVDILLPSGIREHHDDMIKSFLEEGISKYMRKVDIKYYVSQPYQYLIAADFTLDISFAQSSLKFVTFLQPLVHQPMTIVLNSNKIITEVSEHLIETLNEKVENLLYKHMNTFLPSIDTITCSQVLENVELINQQSSYSTNKSYAIITTVTVKIKQQQNRILYYLLTFQYIKRLSQGYTYNQTGCSFSNGPMSCENKTEPKTEIKIDEDKGSDTFNEDITIFKPYIMDDQNQKHPTNSTYFQFQQFSNNYLQIIQERPKRSFSGGYMAKENSQQTRSQIYSTLISPNNSYYLNDHLLAQQQFYTRNQKKQLSFVKEECSIDMLKEKLAIKDEESLEEQGKNSNVTSTFNLRQSPFFKKYKIMNNVNQTLCSSKTCRLLKCALLSLIIHIIAIYIVIIYCNQIYDSLTKSLRQLVGDIELLQIKNQAIYPLESFWVNRWIIFNYMKMKSSNNITEIEYQQLIQFPEQAIPIQFNRLISHFDSILNKIELQSFLSSIHIDVKQYRDTNLGEIYHLSLRSCLNILIEFEYTLEQLYISNQEPNTDSPYMYYSYKNFHILKQQFQSLNDMVYDQAILHASVISIQQRILYLVQIIFIISSFILILSLQKLNENFQRKYLSLLAQCSKLSYELDIHHYQQLIKFILTDSDNLFKYQFSIHEKEVKLEILKSHQSKFKQSKSQKNTLEQYQFNVSDFSVRFVVFFIIILILVQATYVYFMMTKYMQGYQPTALFYRQLPDVGTDIPTLYSHSSVLYGISNFTFLDESDKQQFFIEIQDALIRLEQFINNNIQLNYLNILSENFLNDYNQLQTADLCEFINKEIFANIVTICSESMNGNLKRGISTSLIYILNEMKTERDLNQFTEKIGFEQYELEGALTFSEFLENLNVEFYQDLSNVTIQQLNYLIYPVIVIFALLILTIIFIVTIGRQYLSNRNEITVKSITLIPFQVIYFDDYYELQLKSIQNQGLQNFNSSHF